MGSPSFDRDQNSRTRTPPRSSAIDIFSSVTVKIRQLECGALVDAGLEVFEHDVIVAIRFRVLTDFPCLEDVTLK